MLNDAAIEPVERIGGIARAVSTFFGNGTKDLLLFGGEIRKVDRRVLVSETGRDVIDPDNAIRHTVTVGRSFPVRQ